MSLDDLLALNAEIAALAQAGLPLESGLAAYAAENSSKSGRLAEQVGTRLSQGQTLSEALAGAGPGVPELYRVLVEAGQRAGRLPAALEQFADFARGAQALHRRLAIGMIYPLLVLLTGYLLFAVYLTEFIPRLSEHRRALGLDPVEGWPIWMIDRFWWWIWMLPAAVLVGILLWVRQGERWLVSSRTGRCWGWFGASWRWATFCRLLSMLLRHRVPMPEALRLAAAAAGASASEINNLPPGSAGEPRAGAAPAQPQPAPRGAALPPRVRWWIRGDHGVDTLVAGLEASAAEYEQRAREAVRIAATAIPAAMTFTLGGLAAAGYATVMMAPVLQLLNDLVPNL